jgi:hypothetical protein
LFFELIEERARAVEEIAHRADLRAQDLDRRRDRSAIATAATELSCGVFETGRDAMLRLDLREQICRYRQEGVGGFVICWHHVAAGVREKRYPPACRNAIQNSLTHL